MNVILFLSITTLIFVVVIFVNTRRPVGVSVITKKEAKKICLPLFNVMEETRIKKVTIQQLRYGKFKVRGTDTVYSFFT